MKRAIRSSAQLAEILGLPSGGTISGGKISGGKISGGKISGGKISGGKISGEADFPTFVPLEFLARIKPGDPDDPLLRQVMPVAAEDRPDPPGYSADPVGDLNSLAVGGLLHKYHGRALAITTGACGVHCRYCFRRQFPYSESGGGANWDAAINYLRGQEEIDEVLLSGGDPLTLVDEKLFSLIELIESVGHVKRLRIHSRMPVVIPQRVTPELVDRLRSSRLAVWMVIHANHPAELDSHVLAATGRMIDGGIPVLNQAVLLAGVNDDVDTLVGLCGRLVDHRIMPYYLHQLDRVSGASHFEVPAESGREIVESMRSRLPGYAMPTYVVEQSGQTSKTPLT